MAVELSYTRASVKEVAAELVIDAGRITKWRHLQPGPGKKPPAGLTEEQKNRRLQRALKEAPGILFQRKILANDLIPAYLEVFFKSANINPIYHKKFNRVGRYFNFGKFVKAPL